MTAALFPPHAHDVVRRDITDGLSEFSCVACDLLMLAHTASAGEMRLARMLGAAHSAARRRTSCHAVCVEEPECLFDGEDG